jgi:hypothetical protein
MGSGAVCCAEISGKTGVSSWVRGGDGGRGDGEGTGVTDWDLELKVASRDTEPSRVAGDGVDALLSKAPRLERAKLASLDGFPLVLPRPVADPPSNPH